MPKQIIIFRHGQTDHNKNRIIQGWADIPLNSKGRSQAKKLANKLSKLKIDAFYSSDLKRALHTAEEVGKKLGLKPKKSKLIRERKHGIFENKPWDYINEKFSHLVDGFVKGDRDWKEHQGESKNELEERLSKFIEMLKDKHKDQIVLISTHGGAKRAILNVLNLKSDNEPYKLGNTGFSVIKKDKNGKYNLKVFNDVNHL